MKKLFLFLPIFFFCFSCSESDDLLAPTSKDDVSRPGPVINRVDPNKLSRVVFFPNTTYEKIWWMNRDGLLAKVTTHSGLLIQSFSYANGNLKATNYQGSTTTFTYDSSNHITSVNGIPVTFDAVNNRYSYASMTVNLNSQSLIASETSTYMDVDANGNMVSYSQSGVVTGYTNNNLVYTYDNISPSSIHHHFDTHTNPLQLATLPICKALGILYFRDFQRKWVDADYNSQNNITDNYYDVGDPEREECQYAYNSIGLPTSRLINNYYFDVLEATRLFTLYYYQGDVIPN
jgi:hypothetical protein